MSRGFSVLIKKKGSLVGLFWWSVGANLMDKSVEVLHLTLDQSLYIIDRTYDFLC